MGYVQIKMEVCDIGGQEEQGKPVQHYRIAEPGGRIRTYALCDDHATTLNELLGQLHKQPVIRSRLKSATSMEDVRAARKGPAPRKRAVKTR